MDHSSDDALRRLESDWRGSGDAELGARYLRALERSGADERVALRVRAELEDEDGYLAVVASLPRPSAQQVADWVRFVSCCHSWYKHLRFTPAHVFQFFVSPVPNSYSGSGHYASHPTAFHVEHYGHLEYRQRPESRPDQGVRVEVPEGGSRRVPSALLGCGSVEVDNLMHPRSWPIMPRVRESAWYQAQAYEEALIAAAPPGGLLARLGIRRAPSPQEIHLIWREHAPRERARQLALMEEACARLLDVLYGPQPREPVEGRCPWFENRDFPRPPGS